MDIVIGPMDVVSLTAGICPMCGGSLASPFCVWRALPITIPGPDDDEDQEEEADTPLEP